MMDNKNNNNAIEEFAMNHEKLAGRHEQEALKKSSSTEPLQVKKIEVGHSVSQIGLCSSFLTDAQLIKQFSSSHIPCKG